MRASASHSGKTLALRRTAVWAVSIVALAVLMLGLSSLASRGGDADSGMGAASSGALQSRDFSEQALEALENGDEEKAVVLLRKAVALDPANGEAKRRLVELTVSRDDTTRVVRRTTGDEGGSPVFSNDPTPPSAPVDTAFLAPIEDIRRLLPPSLPGYANGAVSNGMRNAEVAYDPASPETNGRVTRALLAVHDELDAERARGFVDEVSARLFPKDRARVYIGGAAAYFGTDGKRLASVMFCRGRYVFEVFLTADRVPPSSLRDLTVSAGRAFPMEMPE